MVTGARWQRAVSRLNVAVDQAMGIPAVVDGHPLTVIYDEQPDAFSQVATVLRELAVSSPPPDIRFRSGDKVEVPSLNLVTVVRDVPYMRAGQLIIPIK